MVNKKSKKSPTKKKKEDVEKLLLENFVVLQEVLSDLTKEFKGLSAEMSKLLGIFETSAKSFAEKQGAEISKEDKEFLGKLDKLIEQNKVIAKGLTLMEERMRPSNQKNSPQPPQQQSPPKRTHNI